MDRLSPVKAKIHTPETLIRQINIWNMMGKKIVFTNGCFDLLHLGHVDYLAKAAGLGNELVIGVNTDSSVSRLKGPHRPITNETSRTSLLAALGFVSAVILFDEPTPYELIKLVQPDVLVKGADYKKEDIVGYDVVMAKGGCVETIEFLDGYSTSAIEKKIKTT